jgi:Restriction endonuclease
MAPIYYEPKHQNNGRSLLPVTRTLNPLPFHDLEPRRFEDLIRQLAYDFRPWLRLEATGRSGSDDGYDVRRIEPGETQLVAIDPDDENPDAEDVVSASADERTWLIQCKRERKIGPAQLKKYLDDIAEIERSGLYGIIFAACCDFSKRARDIMAEWCRENNLAEFQIWSVSDIETMLSAKKRPFAFRFFWYFASNSKAVCRDGHQVADCYEEED